jgi:hypothetical protein
MKPCILALVLSVVLSTAAPAEPLTDPDKSAFAAAMSASCAARYRLGYDLKGKRYDPPFTEEEISNYCGCMGSTYEDVLTNEEAKLGLSLLSVLRPNLTVDADRANELRRSVLEKSKILEGLLEKTKCVAVERCKKHLNLAYPEKFQHEQCWKG